MAQIVTPLPVHGDVILGRDTAGRILRISRHAEVDRVVLSIWDGNRCMATLRLAAEDVPELVRALVGTLVDEPSRTLHAVGSSDRPGVAHRRAAPWDTAREAVSRVRAQLRHRFTPGR